MMAPAFAGIGCTSQPPETLLLLSTVVPITAGCCHMVTCTCQDKPAPWSWAAFLKNNERDLGNSCSHKSRAPEFSLPIGRRGSLPTVGKFHTEYDHFLERCQEGESSDLAFPRDCSSWKKQ